MKALRRLIATFELLAFYLWELVASNLRVAYDVLTPRHHMRPEILTLPTPGLTERQLLALSNLLSMTPGTLSLDVSDDGTSLSIHCMYVDDADALLAKFERTYVRRIRRVF